MADPIGRRDALPSLGLLDLEKVKRETSRYNHHTSSTINMPAPPLVSPSTTYSGPPPPYSYPSSASSSVVGGNNGAPAGAPHGTFAPSQSRQASGPDKDQAYHAPNPPPKQTLPPITEALSVHALLNSTTAPPRTSLTTRSPTSPTYQSNQDRLSRSRPETLQQSSPRDSRDHETSRPNMNTFSPHLTTSYPTTTTSTTSSFSSNPYTSTPTLQNLQTLADHASYARSGMPNLPPHSQVSPAITHPPPVNSQTTPTYPYVNQTAYSYPPSTPGVGSFHAPFFDNWRNGVSAEQDPVEEVRKAIPKDSPPNRHAYGEYVKRHLDNFDIETSLNEIAEGSGRALDFARHYGIRAHQTQRSGPTADSMPKFEDCENILRQQRCVLESMTRIRDLIYKQQVAFEEQRKYDQQNYKTSPQHMEQESHHFIDRSDGAGGFAGADAKKRRGRAAPPGRCHSCNRAETPEWRRGPDGARTLCNACGLHYAKVTRKMGNKGAASSSNLRPKEDPPSP